MFLFVRKRSYSLGKYLLERVKYPKLILLIISIFAGYLIYKDGNNFHFHDILQQMGYFGTFLAGIFFVYGFTTGPAVASLLILSQFQNFWLASLVATCGAIVGNFFVFKALQITMTKELDEISQSKLLKWTTAKIKKHTPSFVRVYVFPALAGFLAATPLPDELATGLLSWSQNMSLRVFSTVTFFFNTFGIFVILWIGEML